MHNTDRIILLMLLISTAIGPKQSHQSGKPKSTTQTQGSNKKADGDSSEATSPLEDFLEKKFNRNYCGRPLVADRFAISNRKSSYNQNNNDNESESLKKLRQYFCGCGIFEPVLVKKLYRENSSSFNDTKQTLEISKMTIGYPLFLTNLQGTILEKMEHAVSLVNSSYFEAFKMLYNGYKNANDENKRYIQEYEKGLGKYAFAHSTHTTMEGLVAFFLSKPSANKVSSDTLEKNEKGIKNSYIPHNIRFLKFTTDISPSLDPRQNHKTSSTDDKDDKDENGDANPANPKKECLNYFKFRKLTTRNPLRCIDNSSCTIYDDEYHNLLKKINTIVFKVLKTKIKAKWKITSENNADENLYNYFDEVTNETICDFIHNNGDFGDLPFKNMLEKHVHTNIFGDKVELNKTPDYQTLNENLKNRYNIDIDNLLNELKKKKEEKLDAAEFKTTVLKIKYAFSLIYSIKIGQFLNEYIETNFNVHLTPRGTESKDKLPNSDWLIPLREFRKAFQTVADCKWEGFSCIATSETPANAPSSNIQRLRKKLFNNDENDFCFGFHDNKNDNTLNMVPYMIAEFALSGELPTACFENSEAAKYSAVEDVFNINLTHVKCSELFDQISEKSNKRLPKDITRVHALYFLVEEFLNGHANYAFSEFENIFPRTQKYNNENYEKKTYNSLLQAFLKKYPSFYVKSDGKTSREGDEKGITALEITNSTKIGDRTNLTIVNSYYYLFLVDLCRPPLDSDIIAKIQSKQKITAECKTLRFILSVHTELGFKFLGNANVVGNFRYEGYISGNEFNHKKNQNSPFFNPEKEDNKKFMEDFKQFINSKKSTATDRDFMNVLNMPLGYGYEGQTITNNELTSCRFVIDAVKSAISTIPSLRTEEVNNKTIKKIGGVLGMDDICPNNMNIGAGTYNPPPKTLLPNCDEFLEKMRYLKKKLNNEEVFKEMLKALKKNKIFNELLEDCTPDLDDGGELSGKSPAILIIIHRGRIIFTLEFIKSTGKKLCIQYEYLLTQSVRSYHYCFEEDNFEEIDGEKINDFYLRIARVYIYFKKFIALTIQCAIDADNITRRLIALSEEKEENEEKSSENQNHPFKIARGKFWIKAIRNINENAKNSSDSPNSNGNLLYLVFKEAPLVIFELTITQSSDYTTKVQLRNGMNSMVLDVELFKMDFYTPKFAGDNTCDPKKHIFPIIDESVIPKLNEYLAEMTSYDENYMTQLETLLLHQINDNSEKNEKVNESINKYNAESLKTTIEQYNTAISEQEKWGQLSLDRYLGSHISSFPLSVITLNIVLSAYDYDKLKLETEYSFLFDVLHDEQENNPCSFENLSSENSYYHEVDEYLFCPFYNNINQAAENGIPTDFIESLHSALELGKFNGDQPAEDTFGFPKKYSGVYRHKDSGYSVQVIAYGIEYHMVQLFNVHFKMMQFRLEIQVIYTHSILMMLNIISIINQVTAILMEHKKLLGFPFMEFENLEFDNIVGFIKEVIEEFTNKEITQNIVVCDIKKGASAGSANNDDDLFTTVNIIDDSSGNNKKKCSDTFELDEVVMRLRYIPLENEKNIRELPNYTDLSKYLYEYELSSRIPISSTSQDQKTEQDQDPRKNFKPNYINTIFMINTQKTMAHENLLKQTFRFIISHHIKAKTNAK